MQSDTRLTRVQWFIFWTGCGFVLLVMARLYLQEPSVGHIIFGLIFLLITAGLVYGTARLGNRVRANRQNRQVDTR